MKRTRIYARTCCPGYRRGAALVELAVCLPMLILVLLMAMQTADVIYLKQSLHIAGYECARAAIRPDSTTTEALARGEQLLNDRRIQGYSIDCTPSDVSAVAPGGAITVTVTAPIDRNTVLPAWYPGNNILSAQATMSKE